MAKGQMRGNREAKKPKAVAAKPIAGAVAAQYQLPAQRDAAKPPGRKSGGK